MKHNGIVLKILAVALAITAMAGIAAAVSGTGTAADPLVSLSYLTGTYRDNLMADVRTAVAAESRTLSAAFSQQVADLEDAAGNAAAQPAASEYRTVNLTAGQTVSVSAGGEVLMLSGAASAVGAGLTDATAGTPVYAGGALTVNHLYVASADCVLTASGSASLLVKSQA